MTEEQKYIFSCLAEYAKSARATCNGCKKGIAKGVVRFAKLVQSRYHDGKDPQWYHPKCFLKKYNTIDETELSDFETLRWEDQEELREMIEVANSKPKGKAKGKSTKRKITTNASTEEEAATELKRPKLDEDFQSAIKEQVNLIYDTRDKLEEHFGNNKSKKVLADILIHNQQNVPAGADKVLDHLSDIMVFGALKPCDSCNGQLVYKSGSGGYQCTGDATEYTKCSRIFEEPPRVPFKIPTDLITHQAFKGYQFRLRIRQVPKYEGPTGKIGVNLEGASHNVNSEGEPSKPPQVLKADLPLHNMKFLIIGDFDTGEKQEIKAKLEKFGAQVMSNSLKVTAIISTTDEIRKMSPKIQGAKKLRIPVLDPAFANDLSINQDFDICETMHKHIHEDCDWFKDYPLIYVLGRVNSRLYRKYMGPKAIHYALPVKPTVDFYSGLFEDGHLYQEGDKYLDCTLTKSSIEDGTNSYYKIQMIESHNNYRYWIYRSWGRIGMSYGDRIVQDDLSKEDASELFRKIFRDKTGNDWNTPFQKKPGAYEVILDHSYNTTGLENVILEENEDQRLKPNPEASNLPMPIQELIALIFDTTKMKKTMTYLMLDLNQLPLGSLSRQLITEAYKILDDAFIIVRNTVTTKPSKEDTQKLVDLTNRFYSKIPHRLDHIETHKILNNQRLIREKTDMLDSLIEIVLAYDILLKNLTKQKERTPKVAKAIDDCYCSLSTDLEILNIDSEEYTLIQRYFTNTQSPMHSNFNLQILNVFCLNRHGEQERCEPFANLHNKKLLWHGSRTTNFVGILTHGLKISPPGVTTNGSTFGRGIYFADIVSKSALYCRSPTFEANQTGILLLCEVALGNMFERDKHVPIGTAILPEGFDSVKALGRYHPTPEETTMLPNGTAIPLGTPIIAPGANNFDLQHNEYIVFNEAQIKIKYLIVTRFMFP